VVVLEDVLVSPAGRREGVCLDEFGRVTVEIQSTVERSDHRRVRRDDIDVVFDEDDCEPGRVQFVGQFVERLC
jgi:hypothetical protein